MNATSDVSKLATRDLVESAYMCLLGRMPESNDITEFYMQNSNSVLLISLLSSAEYALRNCRSPLFHYNSFLNCESIIIAHAKRDVEAEPDLCTNFLGVKLLPKFMPDILVPMMGIVDRVPIPGNWHADIAEWGAALRAVDLAKGKFHMLELGCGWGCWMVNTGVAAKSAGLSVHVSGVEADEGHIAFAEQACRLNGFSDDEFTLRRGVVADKAGAALFPRQALPGENWGNKPIFDATPDQIKTLCEDGTYDLLPNIRLADINGGGSLDLVHIDIQGGEADFIKATIDQLNAQVRYLVIGTHSREIEGDIFRTLLANGWRLEVERPAVLNVDLSEPYTLIDGIQGWLNSRLF